MQKTLAQFTDTILWGLWETFCAKKLAELEISGCVPVLQNPVFRHILQVETLTTFQHEILTGWNNDYSHVKESKQKWIGPRAHAWTRDSDNVCARFFFLNTCALRHEGRSSSRNAQLLTMKSWKARDIFEDNIEKRTYRQAWYIFPDFVFTFLNSIWITLVE